ncbi:Mad10 [Candidatus Magnetomoraceae bacterium gMMP-15]
MLEENENSQEYEKSFRYKMEHLGDLFVEKLACFSTEIQKSTKGVVLTYNIGELHKEKEKLMKWIGRRVIILRKKGETQNIFNDEILRKLFYKLDRVQDNIEESMKKRKKRLYPDKT